MNRKFLLEKEAFCAKSNVLFLSSIRLSFCFISDHVFFLAISISVSVFLLATRPLSLFFSRRMYPKVGVASMTGLGYFWKVFWWQFFLRKWHNYLVIFGQFISLSASMLVKLQLTHFWQFFEKYWGSFCSTIWSHFLSLIQSFRASVCVTQKPIFISGPLNTLLI